MSKDEIDAGKAKRSGESSDADSKRPTITQQIYMLFNAERVDRGYGVFRHRGNIEPLDQLLGPVGDEPKNSKSPNADERSED